MKPKRGYWYLTEYWYCPVCGRESKVRVRVYDRPKPADDRERHIVHQSFDYCDVF